MGQIPINDIQIHSTETKGHVLMTQGDVVKQSGCELVGFSSPSSAQKEINQFILQVQIISKSHAENYVHLSIRIKLISSETYDIVKAEPQRGDKV